MRMSRKAGLVVSAAVCGALALGAAGEAIASIDDAAAHPSGASPRKAPLPNTDTLKAQAKSLGDISGVLTPVTGLINDVLAAADAGKLPPDRITTHSTAIKKALATAQQAAGPAAPSTPSVSQPDNGSRPATGKTAADLRAAALTGLRAKTDALLKTISAGDSDAVTKAVANSVTALSNFLVSITLGGLPVPDLPGLPTLPRLPGGIS
ncbi:hypothetical protein [Streptomyces chattanoogensis]|uniref:Secreted protein n=1 Tax=Streptomyces chattanoogensis TaxID=66876 RepID=A0A0N0XYV4_9ACTN|nr:hypothetical protein [Streptomyces chattanoogensis]KPC66036.1 hypothetical protein ADL29_06325 [Streptomyces chattanoogensis]